MSGLSPAHLAFLRDPAARLPAPGPEAHAAAMLRAHMLAKLARAAQAARVPVLLIKGAALALDVYPSPAHRPMADIDVLVRAADRGALLAALEAEGGTIHLPEGRPLSADLLGETAVLLPAGALDFLVEVHTTLDKLVPRPLDLDAILAVSTSAPGLPGLLVPRLEDQALLVAVHLASHDFLHPLGLIDLEMLLRRGLDAALLAERARAFAADAALWRCLVELSTLGSPSVPEALLHAVAPSSIRRAILLRAHPQGGPPPRPDERLGLAWALRQTPLRTDTLPWLAGLGRFALLRARERRAHGVPGEVASAERSGQDAAVPYAIPRWARAFLAIDRVTRKLDNLRDGLRDEVMLAFIPERDRGALTAALYAGQRTYLPGGHRFQGGLFAWERKAVESPSFPRSGRILLGASGAGRELFALLDRGYEVVAFDPCGPFVEAAASRVDRARSRVVQATYADLCAASRGEESPLSPALAGAPFSAVIFGWGSFSHVMPARDRLALLKAARAVAPDAPLLLSFGLQPPGLSAQAGEAIAPSKGRVRASLRQLFHALGAPGASEAGDHFSPDGGFFALLGRAELESQIAAAGYRIALFEESPYAHALLVPC
ncbi:MAG: nucleotidyltransferase family protein [Byssovorax sp.]